MKQVNAFVFRNLGLGRKLAWLCSVGLLILFVANGLFLPFFPLPFSYQEIDPNQANLSPIEAWQLQGARTHWLGTDRLGRDVFAQFLYGARTAFLLPVPGTALALLLGTLFGAVAGFYRNSKLKINAIYLVGLPIALFLIWYYGYYLNQFEIRRAFKEDFGKGLSELLNHSIIVLSASLLVLWFLNRILNGTKGGRKVAFPIDWLVLRIVEALATVPTLVLVLFLSAFTRPNLGLQILFFGCCFWPEPARLVRGEMLKIKQLAYIESAEALGLRSRLVMVRHALPNCLSAIFVASSFLLSTMVGLEAVISFFGVGLPPDVPSWGRLIANYRTTPDAWWLLVFPLAGLTLTILSINTLIGRLVWGLENRS